MKEQVRFRIIKPELRILGIDDCSFTLQKTGSVTLIGIVFRGGLWLDGVMKTEITIDGLDATEKIIDMIKNSPHYRQIRVVMLNGITFAGFNVVSIRQIFEETGLPVMAITKEEPDVRRVKIALKNLANWEERWSIIEETGEIFKLSIRRGNAYMQLTGISRDDAEEIFRISCVRSNMPEPLRIAHIVASGLSRPISK